MIENSMAERTLRNKKTVQIGTHRYVLSSIPAFPAQRMLIKSSAAFTNGDISSIPEDVLVELLSYAAIINENGAEVQFVNRDVIELMISDPMELIELEAQMIAKNFSFLSDGRLQKVLEQFTKDLTGTNADAQNT